MLFSHNEPRSLDTYSATQASAPRPIGGRDISCALVYQTSPGQSGECGACNRGLSHLPTLSDYHIPCPDTNSGANPQSQPDALQTIASIVAASILVSWTLAPATTTANGPPSRSTSKLRFTPFLERSVGFGPIWSPQNAPCS